MSVEPVTSQKKTETVLRASVAMWGSYGGLGGEAAAELFDDGGVSLVPLGGESGLEVDNQPLAKLVVGLGALHDLVELTPSPRQFLGRLDPAHGRRRQHADQLSESLHVVSAHHVTWSLEAAATGFLPSNWSRSFTRQREIR